MYESAIVDELGEVIFWMSDITEEQAEFYLENHPECRRTCIQTAEVSGLWF